MNAVALVVVAGRGTRLGGARPKQYLDLGGRPVLAHALATFAAHPKVAAVRAVIHPDDRPLYDRAAAGLDLLDPVAGGRTRQDSVRRGLESLESARPDAVCIHDGARPFVTAAEISKSLAALADSDGSVVAVPVTDTLKRAQGRRVVATAAGREGWWRAQTPQSFRFREILAAHRAATGIGTTDDASLAALFGHSVTLVDGSPDNVKITTTADLERARRTFDARLGDVRVGSGFDTHRFGAGDCVVLCGVRIPHDRALEGHSDADAGFHALADAIFAALAEGDIGAHFPPSDTRWKDADSAAFLSFAAGRVRQHGGVLGHLGVVLICESPRITPVRADMISRIAAVAGIDAGRVSVQGTGTEGLGFLGRGEGVAAQATATVRLPEAAIAAG